MASLRVREPVLAGPGLGDDPLLTDPLGERGLAQHVVDLVRAGVVEVLALEPDARPAGVLGEPGHLGDRARPAGVVTLQRGELLDEGRVDAHRAVGLGQLVERGDQRLRHEPATEDPEVAGGVGPAGVRRPESRFRRGDGARGHAPRVPRPGAGVAGWVGNTLVEGPARRAGSAPATVAPLPALPRCSGAGAGATARESPL